MPIINFPSNPTEGQKYTFGNFTYVYKSNRWTGTQSGATTGIDLFKASLADEGSTVTIAGVAAKDLVAQKDGVPVASVIWFPSREMAANGYIPADGQLLSRTVYASLWKMVEEGKVPKTTSDAEWLSNPKFKGSYSEGDGSTTFRVPDYNGKTADSLGAAFLRGDGFNAEPYPGTIQGDASRRMVGEVGWLVGGNAADPVSPPFKVEEKADELRVYDSDAPNGGHFRRISFDTSMSVPTAPENRPVNVAGVWMIKVFSAAVNEGVIDAAQLGTALAAAESKITELESWPKVVPINSVITPTTGWSFPEFECSAVEYKTHYVIQGIARGSAFSESTVIWATVNNKNTTWGFSPATVTGGGGYVAGKNPGDSEIRAAELGSHAKSWIMFNFSIIKIPDGSVTLEEPEGGEFITLEL